MGIDYVLHRACAAKEHLGVERLVELCKSRSRADAVVAMMRSRGDQRPPADITITVSVQTPEGATDRQVSVQELLDEVAPLEAERAGCATCPADRGAGGFGCYRSIPYPIPDAAEAWLMSRLPRSLATTAGQLLVRALEDFGWDGEHAAGMRADDDTFFESRVPYGVRWGEGDDAAELSSDQLFHLLFHVGHLAPAHSLLAALFLGVLDHDVDLDVLRDPAERARRLAAAVIEAPSDPAVQPMADFVATLAAAAASELTILIDG